jgi:ribonuclease/clavin/mitogillin
MKIKSFGEITQGKLYLKRYSLSVSFYHLDGLLIDTGAPSHQKMLQAYYKDQTLEQVVLTHHHEDHSGLAHWLEKEMKLPILMLPETQEILNHPPKIPFYRWVTWGQMESVQGQIIGSEVETNKYTFNVIHTPGHCSDHLSLLEPNHGFLFTGDLFVASKIKYSLRQESLLSMLHSINKLLTYDFDVVYCAHAGRVKNGRHAFQQKKEFLEELVDKVLFHHKLGLEIQEIRAKIHPKIDWIHYFSAGEFSSHNVIRLIIEEFATPSRV